MSGLEFQPKDVLTSTRLNQKTVFVGTGAQIAAIGTTYPGMLAFCTSTGSGFTAGVMYQRNEANDGWQIVEIPTQKVIVPAAQTSDYATPVGAVASSEVNGFIDDFETDPSVDMNGWTKNGVTTLTRQSLSPPHGSYFWQLDTAYGDLPVSVTKNFDFTGINQVKIWLKANAPSYSGVKVYIGGSLRATCTSSSWTEYTIDTSGDTGSLEVKVEQYLINPYGGTTAVGFDYLRSTLPAPDGSGPASRTYDDDTATYWRSNSEATPWIYVDCGALKLLSGCRIYWNTGGRPTAFDIDVSEDASTWEEVRSETVQPAAGWVEYAFNTRYARYIRIQGDGTLQMEIAEIDYYSKISDRVIAEHGHGDA